MEKVKIFSVKKRCAKCGGEHDYGECGNNVKVNGRNCGGEHSAAFGGCQVQREDREAQRYRISHDVSYAEAVKQIGRNTLRTDGAYMDVPVVSAPTVRVGACLGMVSRPFQKCCAHECAVSNDTWTMIKVDFIAFIDKVINTTWVVESRNARLKVIVEMAK